MSVFLLALVVLYMWYVYVSVYFQAAVLHDTVEDTDTSFEELEQIFGIEVRDIVAECSDDKTLPKLERKRLQVRVLARKMKLCNP